MTIPGWWYREVVDACAKSQDLDQTVMQALLAGIAQADLPTHNNVRVQLLLWLQQFTASDAVAICGNDLYACVFLENAILIAPEGEAKARLKSCLRSYHSFHTRPVAIQED